MSRGRRPLTAPDRFGGGRIGRAALYAGGLMGPFAAGVVASILPELGQSFGRTADAAAAAIPAYFVPFALAMLFSGALGQRWGVRRTVAVAYAVFVLATVLAAVAQTWTVFQAARVLQGLANAFTTPLLLATLARIAPRDKLGAALGLFAALQALGQVFAPLFGGLLAHASWRWAFAVVAVAGVGLMVAGIPRPTGAPPPRAGLWAAWRLPVLRLGLVYFVVGGALTGLSFLVALYAQDRFDLGPGGRGLLLTGAGILAMIAARSIGRQVDRWGWAPVGLAGLVLGTVTVGAMPVVPALALLAVLWALTGLANQAALVALNARVLTLPDAASAVSLGQSARFMGTAAAPVLILPVYSSDPHWGFWAPAALVAVAAVCLLVPVRRKAAEGG